MNTGRVVLEAYLASRKATLLFTPARTFSM